MHIEAKPIRFSPVAKFITVAIIVVLAIMLIRQLGAGMSPFVAGIITAYLFNPLISWLNRRTRIGRAIWILALYVLTGALLYLLGRFLGPLISQQFGELWNVLPSMFTRVSRMIEANQTIDFGGIMIDIGPIEEPVINFLREAGGWVSSEVPHLFATAFESVLLLVTYLIVTFYLLLQANQIVEGMYQLVPAQYRAEIRGLGEQIDSILSSYIRGTLLLIPIMSVFTYIALSILGVRYTLVLAIATGVLETIPLLGPWTAAGIAIIVSLFQPFTPFGWSHEVYAVVIGLTYFLLRTAEDAIIIPQVVGHAVHLHPVLVIFAIIAGGTIGGPFGLFVCIPVTAVIRLLLRYLYRKLVDAPDLPPPDSPTPHRSTRPLQRVSEPPPQRTSAPSPQTEQG